MENVFAQFHRVLILSTTALNDRCGISPTWNVFSPFLVMEETEETPHNVTPIMARFGL